MGHFLLPNKTKPESIKVLNTKLMCHFGLIIVSNIVSQKRGKPEASVGYLS